MKASYFKLSKSLCLENFRKFWALSLLMFLAYLLSGIFPILLQYNHLNDAADFIYILNQ